MKSKKDCIFIEENIPKFSSEAIEKTILESKKAYFKIEEQSITNTVEFMISQIKYISKTLWIIQIILLIVFCYIIRGYALQVDKVHFSVCFSIFAPVLVIVLIPELWKNIQYKSIEIESTTLHSINKIYAARVLVLGILDLICASIMIIISAKVTNTPIYELGIYFLVPFNLTCAICFTILNSSRRIYSEFFSISICVVWAVVWYGISKYGMIYECIQEWIWILFIIISTCYILYMIKGVLNNSRKIYEKII